MHELIMVLAISYILQCPYALTEPSTSELQVECASGFGRGKHPFTSIASNLGDVGLEWPSEWPSIPLEINLLTISPLPVISAGARV